MRTAVLPLCLICVSAAAPGQGAQTYRCPGPPATFTDQITPGDAVSKGCRPIEPGRWNEVSRTRELLVDIDADTLQRDGQTVTAWIRFTHAKPQEVGKGNKAYQSAKHLWSMDCDTRRIRVKQSIFYRSSDGNTDIVNQSPVSPSLSVVGIAAPPESTGESIVLSACALSSKRPG